MAVIKNKPLTFSLILVCLIVVSPMAKAQIDVGGLVGSLPLVGPLVRSLPIVGGLINNPINIPIIQGVVFCTHNGRISTNSRSTPAFPNAGVELQCGKQNRIISSTTTNAAGIFSIIPTNSNQMLLSTLLYGGCKLAVTTPLANCNPTLPSVGSLVSPLIVSGSTVSGGVLQVINLAPTGFLHTP